MPRVLRAKKKEEAMEKTLQDAFGGIGRVVTATIEYAAMFGWVYGMIGYFCPSSVAEASPLIAGLIYSPAFGHFLNGMWTGASIGMVFGALLGFANTLSCRALGRMLSGLVAGGIVGGRFAAFSVQHPSDMLIGLAVGAVIGAAMALLLGTRQDFISDFVDPEEPVQRLRHKRPS
jgi:hypothetical protein